jgi:hypothetical protein
LKFKNLGTEEAPSKDTFYIYIPTPSCNRTTSLELIGQEINDAAAMSCVNLRCRR